MEPVIVDCLCPPKPDGSVRHPEGERITLRATLGFRAVTALRWGLTLQRQSDPDVSAADVLALMTEESLLHGIESWSLEDATGKPLPVTPGAIREHLLTNPAAAQTVGDAADGQYAGMLVPLLVRGSESSPGTPTDASTSASQTSTPPVPMPSKPSLISTIPTAATGTTTTAPGGGSSFSQSSTSAA